MPFCPMKTFSLFTHMPQRSLRLGSPPPLIPELTFPSPFPSLPLNAHSDFSSNMVAATRPLLLLVRPASRLSSSTFSRSAPPSLSLVSSKLELTGYFSFGLTSSLQSWPSLLLPLSPSRRRYRASYYLRWWSHGGWYRSDRCYCWEEGAILPPLSSLDLPSTSSPSLPSLTHLLRLPSFFPLPVFGFSRHGQVLLCDVKESAVQNGLSIIQKSLARIASKRPELTTEQETKAWVDSVMGRIGTTTDSEEGVKEADLVVEVSFLLESALFDGDRGAKGRGGREEMERRKVNQERWPRRENELTFSLLYLVLGTCFVWMQSRLSSRT